MNSKIGIAVRGLSVFFVMSILTLAPACAKDGALCYPYCRKGYHGVGPACWRDRPAGKTN